ncbi:MAG TPA: UDP-N-acetylmuramate dehydrogenase [Bacteroidales bacterium]|nr:UDP-N-acetylmuramate dehydrogenase [Bacteroidales bacterium]
MWIYRNISLRNYNTLGLDYLTDYLVKIRTEKEAVDFFSKGNTWIKPVKIIGQGSNILFTENYKGTILCIGLGGIRKEKIKGNEIIISAAAGVLWDKLVEWTVSKGLWGLENLSLIPGQTGAAAVQNIGAYGAEIKDSIIRIKTVSAIDGSIKYFDRDECRFGYRKSIFKTSEKGKYLITRVYFRLSTVPVMRLEYGSLKNELKKSFKPDPSIVRKAVIRIRRNKLPDHELIGNAGSFFKNPVLKSAEAERIKKKFPDLPCYTEPTGDIKLAAAWLIEKTGWKGKRLGDAGVYDKQALVLVNYGNASGQQIFDLSEMIRTSVYEKFGIRLQREVEVIGVH